MRNLIKKILREEKGFLDSTEEDWEWTEGVYPTVPTSALKIGGTYMAHNIGSRPWPGDRIEVAGEKFTVKEIKQHPLVVNVTWHNLNGKDRDDWFSFLTKGDWEPLGNNLKESEGYLDSTEEDWEWANDVPALSPYSTIRKGDLVRVVDIPDMEMFQGILSDCSEDINKIVVDEEYFVESIDAEMEREAVICGCGDRVGGGLNNSYCDEAVESIAINDFWVLEEFVKVIVVKKNMKYED